MYRVCSVAQAVHIVVLRIRGKHRVGLADCLRLRDGEELPEIPWQLRRPGVLPDGLRCAHKWNRAPRRVHGTLPVHREWLENELSIQSCHGLCGIVCESKCSIQ